MAPSMTDVLQVPNQFGSFSRWRSNVYCLLLVYESLNMYTVYIVICILYMCIYHILVIHTDMLWRLHTCVQGGCMNNLIWHRYRLQYVELLHTSGCQLYKQHIFCVSSCITLNHISLQYIITYFTYTLPFKCLGPVHFLLKEIYTFIPQRCIKLIKTDNDVKKRFPIQINVVLLNFLFIK